METRRALVLSSGGAKGAFQIGAAKYLVREKGYRFSVISGSSIGVINGGLIAQDDLDYAEQTWLQITPKSVFGDTGRLNVAARMITQKPSLFGNDGVRRFVSRLDPAKMRADLIFGAVSQITGAFEQFTHRHDRFHEAVVASAALPMIFPPVHVSDEHRSMVDGAVRNIVPIASVFPYQPDEIVVVSCSSDAALRIDAAPTTALGNSQRSIEIMMHEIFHNDIGRVQQVNDLVRQTAPQGVTLRNRSGRALREYPLVIIEPNVRLGDNVSYTKENAKRALDAGYEAARRAVP